MTSEHVINLLGGLALFIFGMTFMSDGLKKLAGDYMKTILEKLTEKRIMAVLLGAGLTALIQSSNAMCVMTVGFVNAGMMQLERYNDHRTASCNQLYFKICSGYCLCGRCFLDVC